jgi:hypothetical protein
MVRALPHLSKMQVSQLPDFYGQSVWLAGCGYYIHWSSEKKWTAYVAAQKGGLTRIHLKNSASPLVEFGWRIEKDGNIWTNNWWSQDWQVQKELNRIIVEGICKRSQFHVPTPFKHFILRILSILFREKVIPFLKKNMIFRPNQAEGPKFKRIIEISEDGVKIEDNFSAFSKATVIPSPRQNLRHVASADSFHAEEWLVYLNGHQSYQLNNSLVIHFEWQKN